MLAKPLLITPDDVRVAVGVRGQPFASLVDGTAVGNVPGAPAGVEWMHMDQGGVSEPHQYLTTWVYVLVWSAGPLGAITLYGEDLSGRIYQLPGQLLLIPPGVVHAAANPSPTYNVVRYEFLVGRPEDLVNAVREDLRDQLARQIPVLVDLDPADTTP